jgi:uncharacterized protein (DUF1684 family)
VLLAASLCFVAAPEAAATGTIAGTPAADAEHSAVEQWRAARVADLTGERGWLTLVGLFWLDQGENTFGRAPSNRIVLEHPALPDVAGTFVLDTKGVHFIAHPGSGITHDGQPVSTLDLASDTQESPTELASGSLRFFIIERSGKLGVRVRDMDSPRRRNFAPIDYYPINASWVFEARFDPYTPHHHIRIVNILGLEEDMDSPGAIVFTKDGHEWRLDAVLEEPTDQTLFVMFADGTNGEGSYGGGRFMRVPFPTSNPGGGETSHVDFNKAYNPPCAFNDFATCPLPPYQNHVALNVEAGEKSYQRGHSAAAATPR